MSSTRFAMGGKNPGAIEQSRPINVNLAVPASTVSGDVVLVEAMPVYVQEDRDSDGYATCTIPCTHVEKVLVYGRGDGSDSAVVIGEKLYLDAADGQINKDSAHGVALGYALGAVVSGANTEILVGFGL